MIFVIIIASVTNMGWGRTACEIKQPAHDAALQSRRSHRIVSLPAERAIAISTIHPDTSAACSRGLARSALAT